MVDAVKNYRDLITNGSATSSASDWAGGDGMFTCKATWGGGTVKLQYQLPDDSTWADVGANTTLTADGGGGFTLGPCKIRANVATATAVYARVTHISR